MPNFNKAFWKKAKFTYGKHLYRDGDFVKPNRVCALEAWNYAASGDVTDAIPCGAPATMAILRRINDEIVWWPDPAARTRYLKPWVEAFAARRGHKVRDRKAMIAALEILRSRILPDQLPMLRTMKDCRVWHDAVNTTCRHHLAADVYLRTATWFLFNKKDAEAVCDYIIHALRHSGLSRRAQLALCTKVLKALTCV